MKNGRLANSVKNAISGLVSRFLIIVLGLFVRSVFIFSLGNDYLGINGLYTNILSMLSLAELGFGTAMVFSMYKPIAYNDQEKLASLLKLYKKVYLIVGFVVLALGIGIIPFMDFIIKDPPNVEGLTFYYLLFLLNSVISYWFFAYRRSVLTADQKEYICTNYHNICQIVKSIFQIVFLLLFHNYLWFLIFQILFTIIENIAISIYAKKHYEAFSIKNPPSISKEESHNLWGNVKALMASRLGHIILNSTDNIIISGLIGVAWVGLLSNFTLIVDSVTGVICVITAAFSASLGNYFIKENKENSFKLFNRVEFMNSWLYGISAILLFELLNPFVSVWIGEEYILSYWIIAALVLNFFVQGYMNTLWTFRSTLGLFQQGWFRPIIVSSVNIALSIILGIYWGVFGVLIATTLSRASVNLWYDPWIIHKYGFNKPVKPFFKTYFFRLLEIILIILVIELIKLLLANISISIVYFLVLSGVSIVASAFFFWIFSHNKDEYKYFKNIVLGLPIFLRMKK